MPHGAGAACCAERSRSPGPSSAVCQVIGMYDYTAQNDDELAFSKGQLINVLNKEDPDWWKGEVSGQVGLFPSNYVKLTTDMDPSQQCKCPGALRPSSLLSYGETCGIALILPSSVCRT